MAVGTPIGVVVRGTPYRCVTDPRWAIAWPFDGSADRRVAHLIAPAPNSAVFTARWSSARARRVVLRTRRDIRIRQEWGKQRSRIGINCSSVPGFTHPCAAWSLSSSSRRFLPGRWSPGLLVSRHRSPKVLRR
jgi:hypothetical protein